jgi:small subunit ribosomal protein S24e
LLLSLAGVLARVLPVLARLPLTASLLALILRQPFQVVDVIHPGRKPVSKKELREHIAKLHKADVNAVIVYGFQTVFGGGRSTGFGLIYDSVEDLKKYEPRYRLMRIDLGTKKTRTRKMWKDLKKKKRETWGVGRREAARLAKKAAAA